MSGIRGIKDAFFGLFMGEDELTARQARRVLLVICLLAVATHLPLLWGKFINYDDGRQIYRNAVVTNLTFDHLVEVTFTNFRRVASSPMHAVNMINWALSNGRYTGFAVVSLAWFTVMVLVFYRFAGVFLPARRSQLLATALFAVHSINIDVVGWQSARCHLFGATFVMVSMIFWQKYRDEISSGLRWAWYLLAIAFAGIAIWNKSIFIVICALLVLYDFYRRRRLGLSFFVDKLPVFAVTLYALSQPPNFSGLGGFSVPAMGPSLTVTLLNDAGLLMAYLLRLVIPGPVAVTSTIYPVAGLFDTSLQASILPMRMPPLFNIAVLLLLTGGALWLLWRRGIRHPFFGLASIFVALAPVMNIPPRWVEFAYRFDLVPSIFASIVLVALFALWWRNSRARGRRIVGAIVALLLIGHTTYTVIGAVKWRSSKIYWGTCVQDYPDAIVCWQKLGYYHRSRGKLDTAGMAFRRYDDLRTERRAELAFSSRYSSTSGLTLATLYRRLKDRERECFYTRRAMLRDRLKRPDRKRVRATVRECQKEGY